MTNPFRPVGAVEGYGQGNGYANDFEGFGHGEGNSEDKGRGEPFVYWLTNSWGDGSEYGDGGYDTVDTTL